MDKRERRRNSRRRGAWLAAALLAALLGAGLWLAFGRSPGNPSAPSEPAVYDGGDRAVEQALSDFSELLDAGDYGAAGALYTRSIRLDAKGGAAAATLAERALCAKALAFVNGGLDASALLEEYRLGRDVWRISPAVAANDDGLYGGFTALKNGYVLDCVAWLSGVRAEDETDLAAAVQALLADLEPAYLSQAADEAERQMNTGDFERTLEILNMRVSYYPEADLSQVRARVGARLAEAALEQGGHLMADGAWTDAADLYACSLAYDADGRVAAAQRRAREAVCADLLGRGAALEAAGEWTKAIQLYREGLAYDADGQLRAALDGALESLKAAKALALEKKKVSFGDLYAQCEIIENAPGYAAYDRVILPPGRTLGRLAHYGMEPQILVRGNAVYFTVLFSRTVNERVEFCEVNVVNAVELRASSTGYYEVDGGGYSTCIDGAEYRKTRVQDGGQYQYFRAVQSLGGGADISGVPADLTYFVRRITDNAEPLYIRFAHDMPGWADYRAVTQADREALGMLWELYTLMREFPELARG